MLRKLRRMQYFFLKPYFYLHIKYLYLILAISSAWNGYIGRFPWWKFSLASQGFLNYIHVKIVWEFKLAWSCLESSNSLGRARAHHQMCHSGTDLSRKPVSGPRIQNERYLEILEWALWTAHFFKGIMNNKKLQSLTFSVILSIKYMIVNANFANIAIWKSNCLIDFTVTKYLIYN